MELKWQMRYYESDSFQRKNKDIISRNIRETMDEGLTKLS